MVSQSTRGTESRDRLLAAASAEFAARGFSGAKVDRIAARARLNKAMIYYHFRNKAALYREILGDVFRTISRAVAADVAAADAPEAQLRQFVRAIARVIADRPHFAAIWLRELADGGRHIEASIVAEMRQVLATLSTVIRAGVERQEFEPVHPIAAQVAIVGPILMFAASAPVRQRLAQTTGMPAMPAREEFLAHVERSAIGGLRPARRGAANEARRRATRSRAGTRGRRLK